MSKYKYKINWNAVARMLLSLWLFCSFFGVTYFLIKLIENGGIFYFVSTLIYVILTRTTILLLNLLWDD